MNITKNIKNIIFDLGGVVLNIDYSSTSKAFKELGMNNFDSVYSQVAQNNVFNDFEIGKLSKKDFKAYLETHIPKENHFKIEDAWNAMLRDLPQKRINLLKNLKKRYRLFLLSNTNEIHVKKFSSYVDEKFGLRLFDGIFENHYYSNEIGFRKPNSEAFHFLLKENGLLASETLFIDDSIQHIEGAKKVGLKTFFLEKGVDITTIFPDKFQSILH